MTVDSGSFSAPYRSDLEFAAEQDRADPLAGYRDRFHVPQRDGVGEEIYFCGNSLGLQPKSTRQFVQEELDEWASLGVRGHFDARRPWMPYHEFLTEKTAELVGARPTEVVTMNTLTANLHFMLVSFYRPTQKRYKLVIEKQAFPSDRYATESQVRFHGFDPDEALVELAPRDGEACLRAEDIARYIEEEGDSIALVMLPGVQYYTGQFFDLAEIARLGHAKGCVVGFDLAHAVGNLPLKLHDWDVDFAVWCNYKYMNSGPGAVAGCFVHERHHQADLPRFAGWWGHEKSTRFKMGPDFHAIPSAEGWQLSNPPIMALAPILASLEIFSEVGMERLRAKSLHLTGYLEFLLKEKLPEDIDIITPADPARRGCQLSLRMKNGDAETGRKVFKALEDEGVTGDWREPDVIRIAPVPLYNSYMDVYRFVDTLEKALPGH
ncbi:MAG: kynureninase [Gammaproteobacteria bacterium]|nr:kynureninase [Gammaproteobacteria bacterium]